VSWPRAALGNLKTAFAGTYHAFGSAEYAARYLADAHFRMNHRYRLDMIPAVTLRALVREGACKRISCAECRR
jgi:hypothetical protein